MGFCIVGFVSSANQLGLKSAGAKKRPVELDPISIRSLTAFVPPTMRRVLMSAVAIFALGVGHSAFADDTQAPTVPTNLAATAASSTQINLTWTASTDNVGVTGYYMERCAGASCTNFVQIGTPVPSNWADTTVAASTTYRYRTRAKDAALNTSGYSNIATATTPAGGDSQAPTVPTNLAATAASSTQINLTWTASTDNVGVTGYYMERCAGASCTNFVQIGTPVPSNWADTTVAASTTYRYRTRAKDAALNTSGYSNIATATTPAGGDTQAPTVPTNLAATAASSTQINLTWTASTDNVGVTGYYMERCAGASCTNFVQIGTPVPPNWADTTVAASTTYRYRTRAKDAALNTSGYSNIATATTPAGGDAQAPTVPTNLAATAASSTQINLTWTASTDNVGVTGYYMERCAGASCTNFVQIGTPVPSNWADTTVAASTTYRYRTRAKDAALNTSGYSNIATATTPAGGDTQAPTAPTGLINTATSKNEIDLAWNASTDNTGVTGYRVERCTGASCSNFTQIAAPTGLVQYDMGLSASTSYKYRVRATDAATNLSSYSSVITVTTLAAGTGCD